MRTAERIEDSHALVARPAIVIIRPMDKIIPIIVTIVLVRFIFRYCSVSFLRIRNAYTSSTILPSRI